MKNILALDMASHLGWAFGRGTFTDSGVVMFMARLDPGARWIRFYDWLESTNTFYGTLDPVNLIVYEEPITYLKNKRSLGVGYGFEAILHLFCGRNKIDCAGVNISTLKKFSTGDGSADKFKMVRFARQIKPSVSDDNESDALLLLDYARKVILKTR